MSGRSGLSVEAPRPAAPRGPWRTAGRTVWRVARPLLMLYGVALFVLMYFENLLIFLPAKYPLGNWRPPGLAFEDAWFASADGTRLHGWYVPCKDPRAVVLFCHGNGGNLTHRSNLHRAMKDEIRASVLYFDYRGYGRSEGTPSEAGVLADARAARAWLAQRAGVAEGGVVLMGESLGGGVAVDLAAEDGARGLVLENTFTSLPDVAAARLPLVPVRWLMRNRLDSLSKIGRYHGPLLQRHGTADRTVPYALGKRLFDAANEPKRLITVEGGDHNDLPPQRFLRALREFLDSLPREDQSR